MSNPIIYCDMDGVLADFKTAAVRVTGMSINRWMNIPSSKNKWAPIIKDKNFSFQETESVKTTESNGYHF